MRKVIISNSIHTKDTYKSYLSAAYTSGTTILVKSTVGFSPDDHLVIGEVGEEHTELKNLSTITLPDTIALDSALNFSHNKDAPVYKVPWDFVHIERRTSSAGAFSLISETGLQWDRKDTIYFDLPGTNDYGYRYRFRNSAIAEGNDGDFSEYSPTIEGSGYDRNSLGYMLRETRKITQDTQRKIVSDAQIARYLSDAQNIIQGVRPDWWFLRVEDSAETTVSGTRQYALPTKIDNLGVVDSIRYNFNDGTINEIYQLTFKELPEFDYLVRDNRGTAALQDDRVSAYTLREATTDFPDGSYEVWRTPKTTGSGTFLVRFFEEMTELNDVADATQVPIPSILENYAISKVYEIMGKERLADHYAELFWGPPQEDKNKGRLTGIGLLESLNSQQKRPRGQPRSLVSFRGRRAMSRLFNSRSIDTDQLREDYWGD